MHMTANKQSNWGGRHEVQYKDDVTVCRADLHWEYGPLLLISSERHIPSDT